MNGFRKGRLIACGLLSLAVFTQASPSIVFAQEQSFMEADSSEVEELDSETESSSQETQSQSSEPMQSLPDPQLEASDPQLEISPEYDDPDLEGMQEFDEIVTASSAVKPAVVTGTHQQKLSALQRQFPDGKYWNHQTKSHGSERLLSSSIPGFHYVSADDPCNTIESVTSTPCEFQSGNHHAHGFIESSTNGYVCNNFEYGIQCAGFARLLFYKYHGHSIGTLESPSTGIQSGDYIKLNLSGTTHYAFVTSVSGDHVIVGEANVGGHCKIRWGGSYPISQIVGVSHASSVKAQPAPTKPASISLQFESSEADSYGSMKGQNLGSSHSIKLRANSFTRPGYTFDGWYAKSSTGSYICCRKDANGKVVQMLDYSDLNKASRDGFELFIVKDQGYFSRVSRSGDEVITLYARWKPNTVRIRYVESDGKKSVQSATLTSSNAYILFAGSKITGWQVQRSDGKLVAAKKVGTHLEFKDFDSEAAAAKEGYSLYRLSPKAKIDSLPGADQETLILKALYDPVDSVTLYRLYNPFSGEHFYTLNKKERDYLSKQGWKYEGVAWQAASKGDPVYRVYNPNSGDHHYTMDANEKKTLISLGWKDEGIGWYSPRNRMNPLWRQYNPNATAGSHNFTQDPNENSGLMKAGWKGEGIAWFSC